MIETLNIFDAAIADGRVDLAQLARGSGIRMYLYDVDPGTSSCPYHYEYVDEWLLVVEGTVAVRTPGGERTLEAGELVRFPKGPDGAHKIMNRTDAPARTMLLSVEHGPSVSVYPDSNKVGVWPGAFDENGLIFVRASAVPWSHGEQGWNKPD